MAGPARDRWGLVPQWLPHGALNTAAYIAAVTAGLAIVLVALFWWLPVQLTPSVSDGFSIAERLKAQNDIRQSTFQALAALGLVGGLLFTARTYRLSLATHNLGRREQFTARFGAAIDHIASDKIAVRMGGIYALQRLMVESPDDQPTIVKVLAAFCRTTSPPPDTVTPADVQAAIAVIAWRRGHPSDGRVDLRGATLIYVVVPGADFRNADLSSADLSGSNVALTDLGGAFVSATRFERAVLFNADFRDSGGVPIFGESAKLAGARLSGLTWPAAKLVAADLREAHLDGVNFPLADLRRASLYGADLTGAFLANADLRGADFEAAVVAGCSVSGAHLTAGALTDKQSSEISGVEEVVWHPHGELADLK